MEGEQTALILRAIFSLSRRLRNERPDSGITLSALSLLGTLVRSGPVPASELALAERLKPQSLTRIIARLESDGLIERQRNSSDKRVLLIAATEKGHAALMEDIQKRRQWLEKEMAALLSSHEQELLVKSADVMMKLANLSDEHH